MVTIRNYQERDEEAVKCICLGSSFGERMDEKIRDAIVEVYCRYYIEHEPENCFVAVDGADEPKGYILCAERYDVWKQVFFESYVDGSQNPAVPMMAQGTMSAMQPYAQEYPAHLHIDLLPECQGQGVGTKLVEMLTGHLRRRGAAGLMLNVANDNERAIRFYGKCGFCVLGHTGQETAYGMRLLP